MKGILYKSNRGWEVAYQMGSNIQKVLPLHPKDVKQIEMDSLVFDNIEARIAAYPEVDFFPIIDANIDLVREWACLIQKDETIQISKEDLKIFLDAIENPPAPNDELKMAVEKYKNKLG